ncbi:MAG: AmmeMemoRadiSam system protein A [Patescibacteria group bacterium]|nr:AmmeMemoRadiSam system protein A [Patescibacteria group bacterium]
MDPYINLAKETIKQHLLTGKTIEPSKDLPREMLERQAGVFVCFKKKGELRGCIGTYLPTQENVAEEIINSTISAATEDPRFLAVSAKELKDLKVSIDVLSVPELVSAKDIKKLNPKKDGIMVKSEDGFASGLLLPDLEGVDTVKEQIDIACQKAGLDPLTDKFVIYKFTVDRHEEK